MACLFCKIIKGEIPSVKVYEDDQVFCFLDINPLNEGHTLIVPKTHFDTLFDMTEESLNACIGIARKLGKVVLEASGAEGLNFLQNNYRAAHQLIDHAHFHLVPRFDGDGAINVKHVKSASPEELKRTAEKIASGLQAK